jgi:Ca2+-binding RTX toxin-like protein
MPVFVLTSLDGDNFSPTAGTPDTLRLDSIADLQATDAFSGTVPEGNGQDQLLVDDNATGTLTLNGSTYPNIIGLESLVLPASRTLALTLNLDYSWAANNREASNLYRVSLGASSSDNKVNIGGTAGLYGFRIELGAGADTVIGGDRTDFVDMLGGGNDSIDLGDGNDAFSIDNPSLLTSGDIISGGVGTNDEFYISGAGTLVATDFQYVTGFERLVFWPQTGNLSVAFPASFAATTVTATIDSGSGTRTIDVSAWTQAFNVTSNVATAATNIYSGTGNDTLLGGSAADTLRGGSGADTILAAAGADWCRTLTRPKRISTPSPISAPTTKSSSPAPTL